jgi:hypothetical protein
MLTYADVCWRMLVRHVRVVCALSVARLGRRLVSALPIGTRCLHARPSACRAALPPLGHAFFPCFPALRLDFRAEFVCWLHVRHLLLAAGHRTARRSPVAVCEAGTQFTCVTTTTVQILTPEALQMLERNQPTLIRHPPGAHFSIEKETQRPRDLET